jgi:transcriptional regulator with XRE-family HTH domain
MDFLSQNLRHLSRLPGKGQTEAAQAAGLTQSAVSKIARGETREAGYRTVARLAAFYGVSMDDLVLRDLESLGPSSPSQPAGFDEATMSQALELLYLLADARPEDSRLRRPTWATILAAAKAIKRAEGEQREAMAQFLTDLVTET